MASHEVVAFVDEFLEPFVAADDSYVILLDVDDVDVVAARTGASSTATHAALATTFALELRFYPFLTDRGNRCGG